MDSDVRQDGFLACNLFTVKEEPLNQLSDDNEMHELEVRVQESIQRILHPMHSSSSNGTHKNEIFDIKTEYEEEEELDLNDHVNEGIIIYSACYICKQLFSSKKLLHDHSKSCRSDWRTEFFIKNDHGTFDSHYDNYDPDPLVNHHHHSHWPSSSENSCSGSKSSEVSNSGHSTGLGGGGGSQVQEDDKKTNVKLPVKKFQCQQCEKSFARPYKLTAHLRTHTGERPFPCLYQDCGKRFGSKAVLKNHVLTHNQLKSYNCNYCKKTFRDKPSQLEHERNHTNELPFSCSQCNRGFSRNRNLKRHVLEVHSTVNKDNLIPCEECNKLFRSRECLRKHKRIHSTPPIKPFQCNICQKSFVLSIYLEKHIATHSVVDHSPPQQSNNTIVTINSVQQHENDFSLTDSNSQSSSSTIVSPPPPLPSSSSSIADMTMKEEILS